MLSQTVTDLQTKKIFRGALPQAIHGDVWNYALPTEDRSSAIDSLENALAALNSANKVIEKQEKQIRALENLALTDELTGLLNRRGFGLALERELSLARRNSKAGGTLIMIDLDGFKSINDLWGHSAGDTYLKAVAAALQEGVRASDQVGRLGGDEFAVLFNNMDEDAGLKRLAKLEKSFNAQKATLGDRTVPLRASFGLTLYGGSDTAESLFAAADLKLYAQKARRRSPALA